MSVDASSIAGLPTLGRSGFSTLVQHAPAQYDRRRLVFIAMPHVAITADGQIGAPEGFLSRIRQDLMTSNDQHSNKAPLGPQLDPLDAEYTALKHQLVARLHFGEKLPPLFALAKLAAKIIEDSLAALIETCVPLAEFDVAVLVGIHIHSPEAKDYIYVSSFYSIVREHRYDLAEVLRKAARQTHSTPESSNLAAAT